MRPRPTHREEVPGGGQLFITIAMPIPRPSVRLCHGGVLFWMVDAFKHLILSIPTLSIYERVLFFVLRYCVVNTLKYFLGREWQIPNLRAFAFFLHRNKYRWGIFQVKSSMYRHSPVFPYFLLMFKESSRPEFGNSRQRQLLDVGINSILRTRRINEVEGIDNIICSSHKTSSVHWHHYCDCHKTNHN